MKFIDNNSFVLDNYRLSPEEYHAKRKEPVKPISLDIRLPEAFVENLLENTYNLPAETLEEHLISLPPFGTIILFSDTDDTAIEECMKLLWENGFTDIFYVEGGFEGIMKSMIHVTEAALTEKHSLRETLNAPASPSLKIDISGFDYSVEPCKETENAEDYIAIPYEGITLYAQKRRIKWLDGTKIDFVDDVFTVDNPRMHMERPSGTIEERINVLLAQHINPSIASHGGHISLLEVKGETAFIEMGGGCQGCGMSKMTLKQGVENIVFDNVPEISEILDVTDHAAGTNPYYQPE